MFVTMVSNRPGQQKLTPARSNHAGFRAMDATNPYQFKCCQRQQTMVTSDYRPIATYIANLPDNRWLKRALAAGRQDAGQGLENQETHGMLKYKCTADAKNLGEWRAAATQTDVWLTHMDSFIEFPTPK